MGQGSVARRRAGLARTTVLLMLLLAGCAPRFGGPAPIVNGGETAPIPAQITVERGQTLSGIARHYHVPMQAIAEANHLAPPYRILAGGTLIMPRSYGSPAGPSVAMAATPPPTATPPEGPVAAAPLPPPANGAPPREEQQGQPTPLGPSAPARVEPSSQPAPPQIAGHTMPEALAERTPAPDHTSPAAVSLTPSDKSAATHPEAAHVAPEKAPAAAHPAAVASAEPPPAPAHHGGSFLWPVRGHILENYGTGPDGTHNDGINIAAPRGAPVQATDAGVIAYAGNELRGYGNLVLIKHPNGWISAYAHCDLILVKTGQKVVRGQVIARVGSTGNVSAPQLHFELRRGKRPVDPRDYLAPLPSVASKPPQAG